jgi:AraC-like DNA-binding protein
MVKNGQAIRRLAYEPSESYPLDLEILRFSELRHRVGVEHLARTYRYGFFFILCITEGSCTTYVDFMEVAGRPGTLIIVRPQQTHRILLEENCEGMILLFKEEFLVPIIRAEVLAELNLIAGLAKIPEHLVLSPSDFAAIVGTVEQMKRDTMLDAQPSVLNAILRHSLISLLLRIALTYLRGMRSGMSNSINLDRFSRFQELVEKNFPRWHDVETYARELGCSEKSLSRATMEVVDCTAKRVIIKRLCLEAKRLLVQTSFPVTSIAGMLGFHESTNFGKFFRRWEACTPGQFREAHAFGISRQSLQ